MYDAGRGRGLNLQGGAHTAYIPYTTAEETLVCIALGEVSQIYLKFIIIFAVRGRKSVSRGGAGNPPFLASNPDYRLMLKIYCNTQNQARHMGLPNSSKKVLHH